MESITLKRKFRLARKLPSDYVLSRGFTMLFAVLMASVLLAVGVSIFNISLKELKISSAVRESNLAFYTADSGRECAIYWDLYALHKNGGTGDFWGFATTTKSLADKTVASDTDLSCGSGILDFSISKSGTSATTKFTVQLGTNPEQPYCADVSVVKTVEGDGAVNTTIVSQGHNTCDLTDPTAVERGIQVAY